MAEAVVVVIVSNYAEAPAAQILSNNRDHLLRCTAPYERLASSAGWGVLRGGGSGVFS